MKRVNPEFVPFNSNNVCTRADAVFLTCPSYNLSAGAVSLVIESLASRQARTSGAPE